MAVEGDAAQRRARADQKAARFSERWATQVPEGTGHRRCHLSLAQRLMAAQRWTYYWEEKTGQ